MGICKVSLQKYRKKHYPVENDRDVAPLIPLFCVTAGASSQIVTELTGLSLYNSLRLSLWDEKGENLVSFQSIKRHLRKTASKG